MTSTTTEFKTAADVVRWIGDNVPVEEGSPDTNMERALWWYACRQAESFRDMTKRELAEMMLDGCEPLAATDITNELQAMVDDNDQDFVNENIEQCLREFFGVDASDAK